MNVLNLKSLILTEQLKKGQAYDFDYDNQILEHEKYDAKRNYKHNTGYFPGIATKGYSPICRSKSVGVKIFAVLNGLCSNKSLSPVTK